jgi:hypothetical protein
MIYSRDRSVKFVIKNTNAAKDPWEPDENWTKLKYDYGSVLLIKKVIYWQLLSSV